MTASSVARIVALGAITGARSTAGLTAVAFRGRRRLAPLAVMGLIGEMVADKSPAIGNRTDLVPLAGRAVLGGAVGGSAAREAGASVAAGVLLGSATAVIAAHLAMRARRRLGLSQLAGGLVEDVIVGAVTSWCASRISVGPSRRTAPDGAGRRDAARRRA